MTGPARAGTNWPVGIVSDDRVRAILEERGESALARLLTNRELSDCHTADGLNLLAVSGRIAAKETAFNSLRVSASTRHWHDLELHRRRDNNPVLGMTGRTEQLATRPESATSA